MPVVPKDPVPSIIAVTVAKALQLPCKDGCCPVKKNQKYSVFYLYFVDSIFLFRQSNYNLTFLKNVPVVLEITVLEFIIKFEGAACNQWVVFQSRQNLGTPCETGLAVAKPLYQLKLHNSLNYSYSPY